MPKHSASAGRRLMAARLTKPVQPGLPSAVNAIGTADHLHDSQPARREAAKRAQTADAVPVEASIAEPTPAVADSEQPVSVERLPPSSQQSLPDMGPARASKAAAPAPTSCPSCELECVAQPAEGSAPCAVGSQPMWPAVKRPRSSRQPAWCPAETLGAQVRAHGCVHCCEMGCMAHQCRVQDSGNVLSREGGRAAQRTDHDADVDTPRSSQVSPGPHGRCRARAACEVAAATPRVPGF